MVVVVDFHVHPVIVREVVEKYPEVAVYADKHFDIRSRPQPVKVLLAEMEAAGIDRAVLLPISCASKGFEIPPNKAVQELVQEHPDKFVGFASVDPNLGERAAEQLNEAVKDLGLKGVKLSPPLQGFRPDDEKVFPVYREAEKLGVPVLIHAGMAWNSKLPVEYCNPLLLDKVARRFPGLKIVVAHFGWPWVRETLTLLLRHRNVYADLSGVYGLTPQQHVKRLLEVEIPREIVEASIANKILLGSDWPRMEPLKVVKAVKATSLSEETKKAILGLNASRLLGVKPEA